MARLRLDAEHMRERCSLDSSAIAEIDRLLVDVASNRTKTDCVELKVSSDVVVDAIKKEFESRGFDVISSPCGAGMQEWWVWVKW